MKLKTIILHGFKSFAKKTTIDVTRTITGIVGPNGSGKSNVSEAIRFVLGEARGKTMRSDSMSDLIFKGSGTLSQLSRASVSLVLDNREKPPRAGEVAEALAAFIHYDEITLSRDVYLDGTSDYFINGAKVRLRDVQELLALAGIGASKHTLLNQGEADRALFMSEKERRELIEDALGLRVYHLREKETKKKIEKTEEHIREVRRLCDELAPRRDFLAKQMQKIEKAKEERGRFSHFLHHFIYREAQSLRERKRIRDEEGGSESLQIILEGVKNELERVKNEPKDESVFDESHLRHYEKEKREIETQRLSLTAHISSLTTERRLLLERVQAVERNNDNRIFKVDEVTLKEHKRATVGHLDESLSALRGGAREKAEAELLLAKGREEDFLLTGNEREDCALEKERLVVIEALLNEKEDEGRRLTERAKEVSLQIFHELKAKEDFSIKKHDEERKTLTLDSRVRELTQLVLLRRESEERMKRDEEEISRLCEEGKFLIGGSVLEFPHKEPTEECALVRDDLLRALERSKLRLEEYAGIPEDEVTREYTEITDRFSYIEKELSDVQSAGERLEELMKEVRHHREVSFSSGLAQVSGLFNSYFCKVFQGGEAKLTRVTLGGDDEGEKEEGVDISVTLPGKKVRSLSLLSGGEKALVSIALLFALSGIVPPPFIVLDETDAPLDEHNARRYGDMLALLSQKSSLLVITHNRETMSHCDMLYGVTLGVDGASKLLSVELK